LDCRPHGKGRLRSRLENVYYEGDAMSESDDVMIWGTGIFGDDDKPRKSIESPSAHLEQHVIVIERDAARNRARDGNDIF
jgi:hypothetical protein